MTPKQALEEARSAIMSLSVDAADIRPELRQAYRNGFAAGRYKARDVINEMIAIVDAEFERGR